MSGTPMRPTLSFMLSRPHHILSLSFGAGLAPAWPGTVGAVVAFPLYWAMMPLGLLFQTVLLAVMFAAGVIAANATGRALGEPDHGSIVWDETFGMAAVLVFVPQGAIWWIAAFIMFRFFDIAKPWPISIADDRTHDGWGVMLDDALAAVAAVLVLRLAGLLF